MSEVQQDAGEWIEWSGGECPVPPNTIVDIMVRGGEENSVQRAKLWGIGCGPMPAYVWSGGRFNAWKHEPCEAIDDPHFCDIIAYRVVSA